MSVIIGNLHLGLFGSTLAMAAAAIAEPNALHLLNFEEPHMGTLFTIRLYADNEEAAMAAAKEAFEKVAALEAVFSDYDATSEVLRLVDAPHGEPVRISDDLFDATRLALSLSEQTGGAFDITMGPQVRNWRMARRTGRLPDEAGRAAATAASGFRHLRLDPEARTLALAVPGMRLDFGGLAKGLAADAALAILREHGFPRAIIAASGDIALGDPPPDQPEGWKVDIEHQKGKPRTLRLKNRGISTSGDTEQFIEIDGHRYSHIVDPRTGLGLENRLTATVIAPTATLSDALATAACVLGEKAMEFPAFNDNRIRLIATPAE